MEGDVFNKLSRKRFSPANFTVNVGDVVEFVNDDIDLHTVSFNTSNIFEEDVIFDNETNNLLFNAIFLVPSGNNLNYSGGFISSGFIYPLFIRYTTLNDTLQSFPRFFQVKFTAPGTYPYRCDLHYADGMIGEITVVSTSTTPSTSTGSTSSSGSGAGTSTASSSEPSSSIPTDSTSL